MNLNTLKPAYFKVGYSILTPSYYQSEGCVGFRNDSESTAFYADCERIFRAGGWNVERGYAINGYLDLLTLCFLSTFGVKPMHIFGFLGSIMFILGFIAVIVVGATKLYDMYCGNPYRLVTESPYFYLALTTMILGTQLFLAGFIGELIARNSPERNNYQIEKEIE